MNNSFYFSIVIPAYNCEKTIQRTLASITNQTFSNYEVIIINDGSTDGTEKKLMNILVNILIFPFLLLKITALEMQEI